MACEDFSLLYRLPASETGIHFNAISVNSYLFFFFALLALKACDCLEEIVKFHCLYLLRECFGYKYSKTWNFNKTNKGFITAQFV